MKRTVPCSECESRSQSLLCSLKGNDLTAIDEAKFHQHYSPGQNLFYAGNPAAGVYCILSGTVKLETPDSSGKNQISQIYTQGGMVGYGALFSEEVSASNAIAVQPTELCFIPKKLILELIQKNPELSLQFLKQLSEDFRMMETRLQRQNHPTQERIAEALLFLREDFPGKNWTRKEIAEWAGTTTETVIRTLADFEALGLIEQKGRVIVLLDRAKIIEKAGI